MTPPFQQVTTLEKRTSERSISLGHSLPPPRLAPITQESVLTCTASCPMSVHFHSFPVLLHLAADAFAGVSASTRFPGSQYMQEAWVLGSPALGWLLLLTYYTY